MYTIDDYAFMLTDLVRTGGYAEALRRVVRPGAVVVDLGSGPGLFALLACHYGASRVYAIDPNPVIELGRTFAADNGFSDRIEFIQNLSTRVSLPERADVIVSDLPASCYLDVLIDARHRFLAADGVMVPQSETWRACVAEAPEAYARRIGPWCADFLGMNLSAGRSVSVNRMDMAWVESRQLMAECRPLLTLNHTSVLESRLAGTVQWIINRSGVAHGVSVWLDVQLADGVSFSNAPGTAERSHLNQNRFFIFERPVTCLAGDRIEFSLWWQQSDKRPVVRWRTIGRRNGAVWFDYDQSTFFSDPIDTLGLRMREANFVPSLDDRAGVDTAALSLMSEGLALGEVARCLQEKYPTRFSTAQDALGYAGDLSVKYSRRPREAEAGT